MSISNIGLIGLMKVVSCIYLDIYIFFSSGGSLRTDRALCFYQEDTASSGMIPSTARISHPRGGGRPSPG